MIYIRQGSNLLKLLYLLSVAGEYPLSSISLLGNARTWQEMIRRLEQVQTIRIAWNKHTYTIQLLCVSGKRGSRTIRLHRSGLKVLAELGPHVLPYYLSAFYNHRYTGQREDIERHRRVAEVLAMTLGANIEMRPYALPSLAIATDPISITGPCFYPAKSVKRQGGDAMNKTGFTRMTGLLLSPGQAYIVYNARSSAMKWHGGGELKAQIQCEEIARRSAGIQDLRSAILMGHSAASALATLETANSPYIQGYRFDQIYDRIHFIPMCPSGKRLMRLLCVQGLQEKLREALFPAAMRLHGFADCDCDAIDGDKFILSHLDGDLIRLLRFRWAAQMNSTRRYEIVCYPWQNEYVAPLFPDAAIRNLPMEPVERLMSG